MRCHIDGFPERLEGLRKSLGVSQKDFAKRIGITAAAMSQLLSGLRDPAAVTLVKLHNSTGVSIDFLFGINKE